MRVARFEGQNLRCVEQVRLDGLGKLNLLFGRNGAGKTSVLEGLHLLGLARSFRTRRQSELIRQGARSFRAVGHLVGPPPDNASHVIGVERSSDGLVMRADGEAVKRVSQLAQLLPLLVIRPESQELVAGGSEERRRVMDWALFHVEPTYGAAHARYRRALQQRNASLRAGRSAREVHAWDPELIVAAEALDEVRAQFYAQNGAELQALSRALVGLEVEAAYQRGWDGVDLSEELAVRLDQDRQRGFTSIGAHRADLKFQQSGRRARSVLSRGETKLLVLGVLLAHASFVGAKTSNPPILLVDDLASELDGYSRDRFFSALEGLESQSFVTAVDSELIPDRHRQNAVTFHVKQGQITRVL
ncbi:MAG: DNA replication/repair protein RecF [Pseudomonadota bacterium]